jgi:hypothetical protein
MSMVGGLLLDSALNYNAKLTYLPETGRRPMVAPSAVDAENDKELPTWIIAIVSQKGGFPVPAYRSRRFPVPRFNDRSKET